MLRSARARPSAPPASVPIAVGLLVRSAAKGVALGTLLLVIALSPARPAWAGSGAKDQAGVAIDLLRNRHLWHLHRRGLVIPFATEAFRKYTQEYNNPWGPVSPVEGRAGRVLQARGATLRFPWNEPTGEATVSLRVRGASAGQRLSIVLNGRAVKNTGLAAGWQTVVARVPAGVLTMGENTAVLATARPGALFHAGEIAPGASETPADDDWVVSAPVGTFKAGGAAKPALFGYRRLVMHIEVPPSARLDLATGTGAASARFRVAIAPAAGKRAILLEATQNAATWTPRSLSLEPFARKLVALELEVEGDPADAAWGTPRVVVPRGSERPRRPPVRNVILWVADALRSDRLAVYGETRVRTPHITEAARRDGVVFLNNQAASPSSPPSHASIQTGMIPRVHGVAGDKGQIVPGTPMMSTVLGAAGIHTAYIGNNPFGMARLQKPGRWHAFHQPVREGRGADCTALVKLILDHAEARTKASQRFFLSSLAFEPHTPYRYHPGITDRFYSGPWDPEIGKAPDGRVLYAIVSGKLKMTEQRWAQIKALYDGEIEYMDRCFGTLLDGLARLGIADETAVVLTADHGEGFFEHGGMGHAFGHWGEVANVPLVLLVPGLVDEPVRIDTPTSHVDIAPTIIDLMGVTPDPRMQGQSVLPLVRRKGPRLPRVVTLEFGRSYALRARGYRYIVSYAGEELLYDLDADPAEAQDLSRTRPLSLRYFRDLAGFFLAHRSRWRAATWGALNDHGPELAAAGER
jgi:choline-sulfatase